MSILRFVFLLLNANGRKILLLRELVRKEKPQDSFDAKLSQVLERKLEEALK